MRVQTPQFIPPSEAARIVHNPTLIIQYYTDPMLIFCFTLIQFLLQWSYTEVQCSIIVHTMCAQYAVHVADSHENWAQK